MNTPTPEDLRINMRRELFDPLVQIHPRWRAAIRRALAAEARVVELEEILKVMSEEQPDPPKFWLP
jgi:hypothetical protein